MKFDIITLFPNMFEGPFSESIISRAKKQKLIDININQLRDYALDKHKTVDDTPCGGGPGMVLRVDIIDSAISNVKSQRSKSKNSRTILLTPKGENFTQKKAIELSKHDNIILICGHYEGFDQRVHDHLVDEEISIGNYVLTGGEIPAMVLIDTITRMIPGTINKESIENESHMPQKQDTGCKIQDANKSQIENSKKPPTTNYSLPTNYDYPVYTRPTEYKGWKVPEVLLSGNHKKIDTWRNEGGGAKQNRSTPTCE